MPRKASRHNVERQALARALRRTFSDEAVGKMLGMPPRAVRNLCEWDFKTAVPEHAAQKLSTAVGTIFADALAAGERAVIKALREAADALERGQQAAKDSEL